MDDLLSATPDKEQVTKASVHTVSNESEVNLYPTWATANSDVIQTSEEVIQLLSVISLTETIIKHNTQSDTPGPKPASQADPSDSLSFPTWTNADFESVQTSGEMIEILSAIPRNETFQKHSGQSATPKAEPIPAGTVQLLTSYGGVALPQEITLSILEMLKADDQIETLANFEQCSRSCQQLVRPIIWNELVISLRGLRIIWDMLERSQDVIPLVPTGRHLQLWDHLTRLKRLRMVEIGAKHVRDTFEILGAGYAWKRESKSSKKRMRLSNKQSRSSKKKERSSWPHEHKHHLVRYPGIPLPFDSLQSVKVMQAMGDQIFNAVRAHWPIAYDEVESGSKWGRIRHCVDEITKPFAMTFMLGRPPIPTVDIELPPHLESLGTVSYRDYGSTYEMWVARCFYWVLNGLGDRSQTLVIRGLDMEHTNALVSVPFSCWSKHCFVTYRTLEPEDGMNMANTLEEFFGLRGFELMERLCGEIDGSCPVAGNTPSVSLCVPSSSSEHTESETLHSMIERGYLQTLSEDWPLSRKYAWVIRKMIDVQSRVYLDDAFWGGINRPHSDVKALDFGEEGIHGRAYRRIHLDLGGLDDTIPDEYTEKFYTVKSLEKSAHAAAVKYSDLLRPR